jgi:predicted MFS family arabinose efflux permease
MPDLRILKPFEEEPKTLPRGTVLVVVAGSAALAVGIALNPWLGDNVGDQKIWFAVTAVVAILTICLALFGFYRDREEGEYHEYIQKLREIVKRTHDSKAN